MRWSSVHFCLWVKRNVDVVSSPSLSASCELVSMIGALVVTMTADEEEENACIEEAILSGLYASERQPTHY